MIFGRQRDDEFAAYRGEDRENSIVSPPRLLPHLVVVATLIGGSLFAVHYFGGDAAFDQVLRNLATPVGTVWLILLLAAYWVTAWRIRLAMLLTWGSWLLLTFAGSSLTAHQLIRSLERTYVQTNPFQMERFNAVLVLGGGTSTTSAGIPQLGASGDRLTLAARLFHQGKADTIVVSGIRRGMLQTGQQHYFAESSRILSELGIPAANIVELDAGENTAGEIAAFKEWTESHPVGRAGLLTSAWHLPRALAHARRNGVAVVGVPADFLSDRFVWGPSAILPSAHNLYVTQVALKEWLGIWLGK